MMTYCFAGYHPRSIINQKCDGFHWIPTLKKALFIVQHLRQYHRIYPLKCGRFMTLNRMNGCIIIVFISPCSVGNDIISMTYLPLLCNVLRIKVTPDQFMEKLPWTAQSPWIVLAKLPDATAMMTCFMITPISTWLEYFIWYPSHKISALWYRFTNVDP